MMNLKDARKLAYDIKARHISARLASIETLEQAISVLRSGRAVKHRRDNDMRLARTIARYISGS